MATLTTRLQVMVAPETDAILASIAASAGVRKADVIRHYLPTRRPSRDELVELVVELRDEATGSVAPGVEL